MSAEGKAACAAGKPLQSLAPIWLAAWNMLHDVDHLIGRVLGDSSLKPFKFKLIYFIELSCKQSSAPLEKTYPSHPV